MDERSYIEQKQDSWKRLSEAIERVRKLGPKSLSNEQLKSLGAQYRAVVSDLSFARSQGASDSLILHLNELAGRAHGVLYASRSTRLKGAVSFIFRDFPILFRSTFRYTLIAALIFFTGWMVTSYMSRVYPETKDKTLVKKISAKDKDDVPSGIIDPATMSSFIMTNNISVGIYAFVGGITAGAFTTFTLYTNGSMIGKVAGLAIPVMGPAKFWAYILPHGIIELMAIFMCGGAGLMMGSALIAPGNIRRSDALKLAANKALRLFAGTLPLFVIAGIIEGFITPSVLPVWSKLVFAVLTAIGMILYLGFAGSKHSLQTESTIS